MKQCIKPNKSLKVYQEIPKTTLKIPKYPEYMKCTTMMAIKYITAKHEELFEDPTANPWPL